MIEELTRRGSPPQVAREPGGNHAHDVRRCPGLIMDILRAPANRHGRTESEITEELGVAYSHADNTHKAKAAKIQDTLEYLVDMGLVELVGKKYQWKGIRIR